MGKKAKNGDEGTISLRKVVQIHDTFYVSIPMDFRERHGIKKGDTLTVTCGDKMTVRPWEG